MVNIDDLLLHDAKVHHWIIYYVQMIYRCLSTSGNIVLH